MGNDGRLGLLHRCQYRYACWLWPEMRLFETPQDAMRAARQEQSRLSVLVAALYGLLLAAVFTIPSQLWPAFNFASGFFTVAGMLAVLVCGMGTMVLFLKLHMRPKLRESLINRGIPICRRCGYRLHGVESRVCPECGSPIGATVRAILQKHHDDQAR
ncbi:MAG: hypothetical protein ACF8NJ_03045 [Phycisphaerales bacterium JB038]